MRSSYFVAAGALALLGGLLWLSRPDVVVPGPSMAASAEKSEGVLRPLMPRRTSSIASLPDRGNLVAFDRTTPARESSAYTWRAVSLSEEHAIRAVATGEMTVDVPGGPPVHLKYVGHIEHPDGNWTWVGRPAGAAPGTEAILTFGEKAVFGTIPVGQGSPLRITTGGGRTWMMETDDSAVASLPAANPRGTDALLPPVRGSSRTSGGSRRAASLGAELATSESPTVDLLIGYTAGFATRLGGQSQANTRLVYLVDVTNQAYANSQVAGRVRLVKTMQVTYPDATANNAALYALTGCTETACTQVDPALQPLHVAREQYGADVVSLVRNYNDPENGGCGIAWLIGAEQSPISPTDEYAAMSVVSDTNGMGGTGSFPDNGHVCRDETLAHELGHNMGSAHDEATADGDDNVLQADEYGRYPYSFGYKTGVNAGNFFTIMAYGDSGQTRYRVFSNPQVTVCGGYPCGVIDHADNVRSLRQTMPLVAGFAPTVGPIPNGSRARDINGDGRDDLFWSNRTLQQADWWLMNGAAWSYAGSKSVASQYFVAGRGDFDGDGRGDILWEDGQSIWIWRAEGAGFSVHFVANHPRNNWEIAGIGDFNADGRSDIFWSNRTIGQADWWLMNGAVWSLGGSKAVPGQYRVAAIGDFNGDRRDDVVWEDGATIWDWQSEGAGFGTYFIANFPAGAWMIAGAGDVNGDGRGDIFWSNRTIGQADWWLMSGPSVLAVGSQSVPSQYRVAMMGDFDGDGRSDVFWEDGSTMWIWDAEPSGWNVLFVGNHPPQPWTIEN